MNTKFIMVELTFSEIELAGDVKSFISFNSNSCDDENLKEMALASDDDELFKVTKKIASPLKIINIEKITDEMLENAL